MKSSLRTRTVDGEMRKNEKMTRVKRIGTYIYVFLTPFSYFDGIYLSADPSERL